MCGGTVRSADQQHHQPDRQRGEHQVGQRPRDCHEHHAAAHADAAVEAMRLHGTGFAQPKGMPSRGSNTVPIGSMWASGLSVIAPAAGPCHRPAGRRSRHGPIRERSARARAGSTSSRSGRSTHGRMSRGVPFAMIMLNPVAARPTAISTIHTRAVIFLDAMSSPSGVKPNPRTVLTNSLLLLHCQELTSVMVPSIVCKQPALRSAGPL